MFLSLSTLCYFVLVFFSPFSSGITSLGEERANLGAFRTFVRFVLVLFCPIPVPLGVLFIRSFMKPPNIQLSVPGILYFVLHGRSNVQ